MSWPDFELVIRGGRVFSSTADAVADIGVAQGRIQAIAAPGSLRGARVVPAEGLYVLPGIIDVHVHTMAHSHHLDPLGHVTRVAAFGGVTSALVFLIPRVDDPSSPLELVEEFMAVGRAESVIDFGFHVFLPERPGTLEQIRSLVGLGVPTFKLFLAYKSIGRMASDGFLYQTMQRVREAGGLLLLHAEDGELIDQRIAEQVARGKAGPSDFLYTHPPEAEYIAIQKALHLGRLTGCSLYILHVSTPVGAAMIAEARRAGQPVWAETCPQYLTLTDEAMERFGPLAKVSPPLRDQPTCEGLIRALEQGWLQVVSSDHSAHSRQTKGPGYRNIFDAWYGAPGVETLLPVFYDEWVNRRGGSVHKVVELLCEAPARIFGLYPRKGCIQVGADADLVLLDPDQRWTITSDTQHSMAGYTLYEGRQVRGKPVMSLLRGQPVLEGGEVVAAPGYGQFLARPPRSP